MPILLAFLLSALAVVGVSRLPLPQVKAADVPITGPKSVEVPPALVNNAYPPALTLNGSTAYNNKFSPDPYADLHLPLTMVYDLHFIYRLGRVDLYNNGPGNSLRQVRLYTSADGRSWAPAGGKTLRDIPTWETMLFPEVAARFVKLEIHAYWGSLPEFRQIAFFASRAQGLPADIKRPVVDGPSGDAILLRTVSPTRGEPAVRGLVFKSSNALYFYDPDKLSIDVGPLPPGRYLASMLFDEPQALPRTMSYAGPSGERETFTTPGPGRLYKTFRFDVGEGGRASLPLTLLPVEGPNAFFSSLWVYRRSEATPGNGRQLVLSAWPFAPAPVAVWKSDSELARAANRLREEGVALFHSDTHWGLDLLLPESEYVGGQARFETLDVFFHDGSDRRPAFGPETIHLRVSSRDRGDGKPVVDLIPHLGSSQTEAASNILDQPRYGGFQGFIQDRRLVLLWPRVNKASEGAFLNVAVDESSRPDAYFLASRSTAPQDWASVRLFRFREVELTVPPQMIPGLSYELGVRDPFETNKQIALRLTEMGRTRNLTLESPRSGSHFWRGTFTPENRVSSGDRLRFDYQDRTAYANLQTGDDAVLMLLGSEGTTRESLAWIEGENLVIRVVDDDFTRPFTNEPPKVELDWDSGRVNRSESLLLAAGSRPVERELRLKLPAVTNIDPQAGTYRLTVSYRDLVGNQGFKERFIHKSLMVRERIVRRPVRRDTWTKLGEVAGEEVSVRVGTRSVGMEVRGGVFPPSQAPGMTGSEGWLFFVNEEPDRRDSLDRWLYRRTYLLVPGAGLKLVTLTNTQISFETNTRTEGHMEWRTQYLEQSQFIPELSTNGVPLPPGTPLDGLSNLVYGGHWVSNVQALPVPVWKERQVATVKPVTNVQIKVSAVVQDLARPIGGPETGALRFEKGEGAQWRLEAELVRPVTTGLLFNAMRFRSDGSQLFLAEPIQGDPFRGLFLDSPAGD